MPIPLRADYDAARLRASARESKDAGQTRRLLALAAIYDGASRSEAAGIGGVTLQIVRDWVVKLNAHGPDSLVDYKGPGPQPILTKEHRAALATAIEDGPMPAIHGVVRWRIVDLVQWLSDEFQVSVSKQTLGRELRAMGYRKLSARPRHHAQAVGAIELFKRVSPRAWMRSGARRVSSATI
jgi:transposase